MGLLDRYNKGVASGNTGKIIRNPNKPLIAPDLANFDQLNFPSSSLDLTNPNPLGGPINVPNNGHSHEYLPTNKFTLSPEGQVRGDGELQTTFNKTSLDLENPNPLGGPINVAYTTKVGSEIKTSPTTQPYTPQNTYTDSFTDPRLIARTIDPYK